MDTVNI